MKIQRFEESECWQVAREFVKAIYSLTNKDIFRTDFALKDQIRRSSISIMANIAEGFSRNSDREFRISLVLCKSILKSLPTSLFQREEKHFPLWERGIEGDFGSYSALLRHIFQKPKVLRNF